MNNTEENYQKCLSAVFQLGEKAKEVNILFDSYLKDVEQFDLFTVIRYKLLLENLLDIPDCLSQSTEKLDELEKALEKHKLCLLLTKLHG